MSNPINTLVIEPIGEGSGQIGTVEMENISIVNGQAIYQGNDFTATEDVSDLNGSTLFKVPTKFPTLQKETSKHFFSSKLISLFQRQGLLVPYNNMVKYYENALVIEDERYIYRSKQDANITQSLLDEDWWEYMGDLSNLRQIIPVKINTLLLSLPEPSFANPTMTSNVLPAGWIASATSEVNPAWRAFDNTTTAWTTITSPTFPQIITLESPSSEYIENVTIVNNSNTNRHIRNAIIQGWDGSVWDDIYTITDRPNTVLYSETYTIKSTKKYSKTRVNVSSYYGGTTALEVGEITVKYGKNILTVQSGMINAGDMSKYIIVNDNITLNFDTNGLNARSTNTSLSIDTWYYIFIASKVDGTVSCIIDSRYDGSDALIDFTDEGYLPDTMKLVGVWQTDSSNILTTQLINVKPYLYGYSSGIPVTTNNTETQHSVCPILDIYLDLNINTLQNNVAGLYIKYKGSSSYKGITMPYTQIAQSAINGGAYRTKVLTEDGTFWTYHYSSDSEYMLRGFEIL